MASADGSALSSNAAALWIKLARIGTQRRRRSAAAAVSPQNRLRPGFAGIHAADATRTIELLRRLASIYHIDPGCNSRMWIHISSATRRRRILRRASISPGTAGAYCCTLESRRLAPPTGFASNRYGAAKTAAGRRHSQYSPAATATLPRKSKYGRPERTAGYSGQTPCRYQSPRSAAAPPAMAQHPPGTALVQQQSWAMIAELNSI